MRSGKMGTNVITELDTQLAALNQLKPPGASKGKIGAITQLCVNNIQVSNFIQSIYTEHVTLAYRLCKDHLIELTNPPL